MHFLSIYSFLNQFLSKVHNELRFLLRFIALSAHDTVKVHKKEPFFWINPRIFQLEKNSKNTIC